MVEVLHKELEYKVQKLKYKKVGGHAAKDQNQIWTFSWQIHHPRSVHTKFYSRDWLIQDFYDLLIFWRMVREGEGGLINFLSLERGAY